MLKDFKVEQLRKLVIDAKVLAQSGAFSLNDTLAVNRLSKMLKDTIEGTYETDLDFIQRKSDQIRADIEAEVRKKFSKDDEINREFARRITNSKEIKELTEKENEINEAKLKFGLDKPIKLTARKDTTEKLDKLVYEVKYRCADRPYNPRKCLLDLIDEGFIELKEEAKDEE